MRIVCLLLATLLASCSTLEGGGGRAPNAIAHNVTVQKGLTYSPADWPQELKADLYAPRGVGPHTAVLVVHGGNWYSGERRDMRDVCMYLAERGFVAVAVDYRLAPAHRFPAALHDLQQALRWLRTKSEALNVDADRIGVFGYSTGGHLAALLGTIGEGDLLDTPHGGPQARVQAVVAGGAPTDLRKYENDERVAQFLGGTREQIPEVYALASPVTHVSANDPPFFLYHGTLDLEVSIDHSTDMKVALEAAGVHAELLRLTARSHVLTYLLNADTLEEAARFLDQYLRARAF